ncbi:hypothetical protein ACFE04_017402 [Oxalis oulophora]
MDVKSLAKSKRAHTQHHHHSSRKPHNKQPKAQSDNSSKDADGGVKKVSVKQVGRGRVPGLPSNWDRYDDDNDDVESQNQSASQQSDVVVPKSKGADYAYLLSEAESQSRTAADYFPYLDDVLPGDFYQALGSMLSVRGEEILSWIGNDNFVVDDDSSVNHEAEFLSLNLHALANELEKVDLPTRLFIEPDLLPPELWQPIDGSKPSTNLKTDGIRSTNKTTRLSEELVAEFSGKVIVSDQKTGTAPGFVSDSHSVKEVSISGQSQVKKVANSTPFLESNPRKKQESGEEYSKPNSSADSKRKTSTFEANAAESELDNLLDSFEVEIHDSPVIDLSMSQQSKQDRTGLTQPTVSVTQSFDDVLDDLLGETSDLTNQRKTFQALDVNRSSTQSSSSHTGTDSKPTMDDFDSWLGTL